jgi:protein ImuA
MGQLTPSTSLAALRAEIAAVEASHRKAAGVIPFGVPGLDAQLSAGGLQLGALHEVAGGGLGAVHGAAAVLFVAGVLARMDGPVLWCLRQRDLFAPALAGVGLHPERVIYAEAGDEKGVLAVLEDGLRHGGLAVVGEVGGLAMTPSRRLQLAAEAGGTTAFAVRRWRTPSAAADYGQPTASVSRWRVSALPATREAVPGLLGRSRWLVEMMRCRGALACEWELEACDETGRLCVPAELADRPLAEGSRRGRAAG